MLTDLPNLLTLSRIIVVPIVVALVVIHTAQTDCAACVLFILAGITDYFDGKLARAWNQNSDLGRMLDPIADKLLVGASLMVMAGLGRLPYGCLYPAIIILCREILVSGLREYLAATRVGLPVTKLAKWKTGFQMTAIGFLLAGDSTAGLLHIGWLPVNVLGAIMMWIAAALTLITGWDYVSTGLRHVGRGTSGATKLSS
ncbi:CDP-diacylglycerol--glycerol-3-phosphate 3-phosphatidyltransferase [Komagataeibacter sp. AV436]|uniref:CDP-diacylglycerol--glycerol-3-phosphate 3-phosphatidyltransferase n=1 Tax=Komagataeibacter melomenusus TaxID=2766578 RepID=A0ABX2AEY1_9PROT|nr:MULTISPECIES: CDP-diacylglycerol--glycerol-3-phosphate 3-phosphatidyltransferase [Komagataeibacter]MBV1831250.1 CDP-diacylglycerol--glycerol-3-phosphate 3-phosphatidyltransferase [Komagataeibacter melomenusus]NPC66874.1 CDP-diacylglycerol--glycerol-3-phosphate 3-phosphatidyltransferase [Komagataeibacter melomenusus]